MFEAVSKPEEYSAGKDYSNVLKTSLRVRVTLGVVLPLTLILGLLTAIQYHRQRELMLSNLTVVADYSAQVIEENILHQMQEADLDGVQKLLSSLNRRGEFEAIYILDANGTMLFPSGNDTLDIALDNQQSDCQSCHGLFEENVSGSVIVTNTDGQRILRSMHPLENGPDCNQCHAKDEQTLGLLVTDIAIDPIAAPLLANLQENIVWSIGMILIAIVVVNLVVDRFVLHRLQRLAQAIAGFGNDPSPALPTDKGKDEIGQLTNAFHDMVSRIEKRRQENQILSERLRRQSAQRGELLKRVIQAQEDERKRVARELHDDLGQTMGGLALRTEVLGRHLPSNDQITRQHLAQIQSLIASITAQMYDIILDLRPSVLDDLGLIPALRAHAQRLIDHNNLDFRINEGAFHNRLPREIEMAIFRVFQEALNNTIRHAQATQVHAILSCENGAFRGEMADNGKGFDPETILLNGHTTRGLGLLGMQERILQCGGKLEIKSKPGSGTRITIWIPLPEVNCD